MTAPVRPSLRLPGDFAAVVLDLDGLLVQTERLWFRAKETLFERHATTFTDADHRAVYGTSDVFTATYFAQRFGQPASMMPRLREEYLALASDLFEGGVELCPGAAELVEGLSGRVPLALASNTRRAQIDLILQGTPFGHRFETISSGDDGEPKPAPDLYLLACRRLGVDPARAVALEDSPPGVAAARAAGLTCIGVPSHPEERLPDADMVVDSLLDLLEA